MLTKNFPVRPGSDMEISLSVFLGKCSRRNYPVRSTILCAGDASEALYYIVQGSVSVVIEDDEGREMIVAYLNKGDFFGEMGLFDDGLSERSAWVKAKTACEVAEISYQQFKEVVQKEPDILMMLSGQIASRLKDTTRKVGDLAFLDVTGRVATTNYP